MRSPVTGIVVLLAALLVAIVAYMSLFTVQQTEQTIVLQFGKPVDVVTDPGLHFKAPWNSVINIDKRILDLENPRRRSLPPTRSGSWSTPLRATASRTRCASTRAWVRSRRQISSSLRS